jgi:hypothetical protein
MAVAGSTFSAGGKLWISPHLVVAFLPNQSAPLPVGLTVPGDRRDVAMTT